jgi:hypothetical protein
VFGVWLSVLNVITSDISKNAICFHTYSLEDTLTVTERWKSLVPIRPAGLGAGNGTMTRKL